MGLKPLPTLCNSLDRLLGGGIHPGQASLVFGEAATGKTCLAIQCAVNCARMKLKTIYVDADQALSPMRILALCGGDRELMSRILVFMPKSFEEQADLIDNLSSYVTPAIGLVVMDTITSLYRAQLGTAKETFSLNVELNRQIASLVELARSENIAVLLLSQVHAIPNKGIVKPVAHRLLEFWSDTVLMLEQTPKPLVKEARLLKHKGRRRKARCLFKLTERGIEDVK